MKLPNTAHTDQLWRIHEITQTSASMACGPCRLPVVLMTFSDSFNN